MDLAGWFYSYFNIRNVVIFLIFVVVIICWTMDRISRRSTATIDDLQGRVRDIEKRLGINEPEE